MALRILLVDDEAGLREAVAESLRMRGHLVAEACGAAEALRMVEEERYDVVVTDIRLGPEDGLEVGRRIREIRPAIELIFITGYGSLDLAIAALRLGAVDFIRKPFRIALLAEALDRAGRRVAGGAGRPAGVPDAIAAKPPGGETGAHEVPDEEARREWELRELLWKEPLEPDDSREMREREA